MAGAPRAASRIGFSCFISEIREIARGVTAMVVGSGALLGLFFICAWRIRLRDNDVGADGTTAFPAEAFDNNLSVFLELLWLLHPKISFVAGIAPRVVGQPLLLAFRTR